MPFLSHLDELRKRIFYSLIAAGAGATLAFFFSNRLLNYLTRPVPNLVFLAPSEAFVVQLKVALVAGVLVASPVIFYQFWRFVRPALKPNEASYITLAVLSSTIFFAGGVAFAWVIMIPFAMKFLLSFQTAKLQAMLSINNYTTAVGTFMLAAGLIFQMPVVIFFLTKLGLVQPRTLWRNQRIAIVIIFIIAAILSPPDVFSQCVMAVPLLILFELSIFGSFIAARGRKPRELKVEG